MPQGLLYLDDAPPALWRAELTRQDEFRELWVRETERFAARRTLERQLAQALPNQAEGRLPAFCAVCGAYRALTYDHNYAAPDAVNWRERLLCPVCGLNNRQRLALHWVARATEAERRIYATEQTTAVAEALRTRYRHFIGSEYLGPGWTSGRSNAAGIRHEDVTALSLPDQSVDWVLSFDVLEHVPDYRRALCEFQRVLAPGGTVLLTMPMALGESSNVVRATVTGGGKIVHYMEPEYHGDPVNPDGGILCFYHFGWQILDDLAAAGFLFPRIVLNWSLGYGYLGNEQVLIVAETPVSIRS